MQLVYKRVQPGPAAKQGPHDSEFLMPHHHLNVMHVPQTFTGHHISSAASTAESPLSLPSSSQSLAVPSGLSTSALPSQAESKPHLVPHTWQALV